MKKTYQLENLDCAACAAKMETAIAAIAGVEQASISFLTQKLRMQTSDSADTAQILQEAMARMRKIEPGCKLIL